jgi:hypothetical protein
MNPQPVPTKQSWLIILGALAVSSLLYGLMAYFIENGKTPRTVSPGLPTMRTVMTLIALAELGASVAWLHFQTLGKMGGQGETLLSPAQFQTQSIIAMALAESCSVSGLTLFFMGQTLAQFAPFIFGTLAVFLFWILPKGLRYWAAWENDQKPKAPSPFS